MSDKLLCDLGQTYSVLRRLGFSQERTLEAIRAIPKGAIDDALDWVCSSRPFIF